MAARTYVIDLRHYLDADTEDSADLPGPALNLATFSASIVTWATDHPPENVLPTNVWCFRRPGRKRCRGEIVADLQRGSADILWHCPWCGVNGVIRGWEGTVWHLRPGPS